MEILLGILYAAVGGLVVGVLTLLARLILSRGAVFRDTWDVYIPEWLGQSAKHDEWRFRPTLMGVRASILRLQPHNDGRRWKFSGRERGGDLIGAFWNAKGVDNSQGAIYLKRDEEGVYCGKYFRKRDSQLTVVPARAIPRARR